MIKFYRNEETKAIVVALQGEACPGMKALVANTTDAALESEGRLVFKYLKPGDKPVADFCDAASGTVYEYCNLHGLWKAEF